MSRPARPAPSISASARENRSCVWTPGRPVDIASTLSPLGRGRRDPTYRIDPTGAVWWATSTPCGDGTLRLAGRGGEVHANAWGDGAEWLIDGVPSLLGADDEVAIETFRPDHDQVREALRRVPGWRVPRTRRPVDACIAAVLEQKVTGLEARSSWRMLVTRFGRPAPGPIPMTIAPPPRSCAVSPIGSFGGRVSRRNEYGPCASLRQLRRRSNGPPTLAAVPPAECSDRFLAWVFGRPPKCDNAHMVMPMRSHSAISMSPKTCAGG